ncbi:YciI family protein [Streptosporangium sp. NPDC023825]|uniref:YciI family protein n=1 Tax=Streptosporangium sp. NPDC023825 TaxID=3154909 RepID=UPI00342ABE30
MGHGLPADLAGRSGDQDHAVLLRWWGCPGQPATSPSVEVKGTRHGPDAPGERAPAGHSRAGKVPFAERRQDFAGFYLVDCADLDEALEIAARCPMGAGVEVRPVWDAPS